MHKKKTPFAPFHIMRGKGFSFNEKRKGHPYFVLILVPGIVIALCLTLVLRLFQLTVIKGSYYQFISENNRIKEIALESRRGSIIDRKGIVLAGSKEAPSQEEIKYFRTYPFGESLSHVIGYRQIASKKDIEKDACQTLLKINDTIGVDGLERLYDCTLRGKRGKRLVEVDAHGKHKKTLAILPAQEGVDVRVSIDAQLSKHIHTTVIENAIHTNKEIDLNQKKLAVVVLKATTGEVLSLLSHPTFDPSNFEMGNSKETTAYLSDKNRPLLNRATQGLYPPGSTIKPFFAIGALQDKIIDKNYLVEDTGIIKAGPITFGNWYYHTYGKTDGMVDVIKGIQRSNDIFYYTMGAKMGPESLRKWARTFEFGSKTGVGLAEETGLIPSSFWKQETLNDRWYLGDTYNLSIGQGYMLATPLQIAHATQALANNGIICTPTLEKVKEGTCKNLNIDPEALSLVREGMKRACESGGTGWPFFNFGFPDESATPSAGGIERIAVGCKTGTSESQSKESLPHAWFTIFAPLENPEIVVTVLVENAGDGSDIASPIAREILEYYFSL